MHENAFRRHAISLVLTFGLLLISFVCLQQSRTIDSQRTLIRSLFHDSLELNALKVQKIREASAKR